MSTPRLKKIYINKISHICSNQFGIKNYMNLPKLVAIYISMGLGDAISDFYIIKKNKVCLEYITGQIPIITTAKKSIASFKLREGMSIGLKVTLRKNHMWEFLDRFINIALPRVKDFRGIKSTFDNNGNLTIGIKEQIIFPEVEYDNIDKIRGMNITIVTSSNNNIESKFLLQQLGIPFRK